MSVFQAIHLYEESHCDFGDPWIYLDLAIGLLAGILVAGSVYVWDSPTRVIVEREIASEEATSVTYNVTGPIFYATAGGFSDIFPVEEIQYDPDEVVILLEGAEVYNYSGMVALKKAYDRFEDLGKVVALSPLTPTSRLLMEKSAYIWQGYTFLKWKRLTKGWSLRKYRTQSIEFKLNHEYLEYMLNCDDVLYLNI